jgi:uncharacterized protein (DUF305 family)
LTAIISVILVAIVASVATGVIVANRNATPGSDSVEAGFLRDMKTHHGQAVQMALTTYRRSADPEIVQLTYDMGSTQQSQVGMMMATLDLWDLPQGSTGQQMAWMGDHMAMGGLMPGMATQEQLDLLSSLPTDQADILFLQLMIVHHRGGVDMAQALLDRSDNDDVRGLAEIFLRSQEVEIETMNNMLVARGAAPVEGMTIPTTPAMPDMSGTPAMPGMGATPAAAADQD